MVTAKLDELDLVRGWSETDEHRAARFTFPFFHGTGARSSAVVYFEVDPGDHLGTHTDSAEEIVLLLAGTAEVVVGDERGSLATGEMALIPAMVPHDVINAGEEPLRVVGWFSSASVISVFDQPFAPFGRRVLGTPLPEDELVATDG